jgi:hypothetical protein
MEFPRTTGETCIADGFGRGSLEQMVGFGNGEALRLALLRAWSLRIPDLGAWVGSRTTLPPFPCVRGAIGPDGTPTINWGDKLSSGAMESTFAAVIRLTRGFRGMPISVPD